MRALIDIGCNLLDHQFQGIYNGKRKHVSDFDDVLGRAQQAGVERVLVTAGSLKESREALYLCSGHDQLFCTVGVHPTRCSGKEIEKNGWDGLLEELYAVIQEGKACKKVVAVGEFGLDFDRLRFCGKEDQMVGFKAQFELCRRSGLPAFLHHRACGEAFIEVFDELHESLTGGGVVHSFDGTIEEANYFLDKGLYLGINGCSLKLEQQLSVVKQLPMDRLLLETDGPWCEIKPTHASHSFVKTRLESRKKEKFESGCTVKGRQEPAHMIQVAEVVAGLKDVNVDDLIAQVHTNTLRLFFPNELHEEGSEETKS